MHTLAFGLVVASAGEVRAADGSEPATAPPPGADATNPRGENAPPEGSEPTATTPATNDAAGESVEFGLSAAPTAPPPQNHYLQYGIALAAEFVASAGPICDATAPCILGSGGGFAVRVGVRAAGPWLIAGAYELSKQDPNNLYRFATLQQARADLRYYLDTGYATEPYLGVGGGLAAYGNEWGIDTWGPTLGATLGTETQISRTRVIGISLTYRAMLFKSFTDPIETQRAAGIAQFISLELSLEARDPL